MKDMIPKGTGNSRFLRSVSNFKAIYPTYDDFVNALVAGTLPVDFNGINEAGVQQVGTALNKANLLTDEVAQKMGLAMADPRPIDMFGVLADAGNIHVWAFVDSSGNKDFRVSVNRNAYQEGTSGGTTITYLGKLGDKARIEVGSYVGTGKYGASNPNKLTFGFEPKMLIIGLAKNNNNVTLPVLSPTSNGWGDSFLWIKGQVEERVNGYEVDVSSEGKTVSWYSAKAANFQCNGTNCTYLYLAIG